MGGFIPVSTRGSIPVSAKARNGAACDPIHTWIFASNIDLAADILFKRLKRVPTGKLPEAGRSEVDPGNRTKR